MLAQFAFLTACGQRSPIIVGALEKNSSCVFPVRENWTPLCLSIEAVERDLYKEGERFEVILVARNDGASEAENVVGRLQSFAFKEQVIEFGNIAPRTEKKVELRIDAEQDRIANMRLFVPSNDQCDFRSRVTFPPVDNPKRVGPCRELFMSFQLDRD